MIVKKTISFGVGVNPKGENKYIWINTGKEMDAMIILFSLGWSKVDFVFENCVLMD